MKVAYSVKLRTLVFRYCLAVSFLFLNNILFKNYNGGDLYVV